MIYRHFKTILLCVLFFLVAPGPQLWATPSYDDLKSDLDGGGTARIQAIWYVYRYNRFELLPYIAKYLDNPDMNHQEKYAVLSAMYAYKDNLERYLPDWPTILDSYIQKELPEKNLLMSISIIDYFKENKMIHALLRLTADTRSKVRMASYRSIDHLGNDRLIPVLLDLAHHKRAIFRLYALEAMLEFNDNRLLPGIQKALSDESKSVRIYAILALARQQNSKNLSYNAGTQFSRENDFEVRKRVIEIIRKEKWHNLIYLVHRGISDPSDEVREQSLYTVQELANKSAASFISRQLSSEKNQDLIELEMNTLCMLGTSGYGNGLVSLLRSHSDYRIRAKAAFSLGFLKDSSAISALKDALIYDKAVDARVESAWALGKFRDSSISHILQKSILNDKEDYNVRSAAFLALFNQKTSEATRILNESAQIVDSSQISRQIKRLVFDNRK